MANNNNYNFIYENEPGDWRTENLDKSVPDLFKLFEEMYYKLNSKNDNSVLQLIENFVESRSPNRSSLLKALILKGREEEKLNEELIKQVESELEKEKEKIALIRKKEAEENAYIEHEIERFKKELETKRINFEKEKISRTSYAFYIDSKKQGSITFNPKRHDNQIYLEHVMRLKDGIKGIGQIMIEWLVIYAYENAFEYIFLTAAPDTVKNIDVSSNRTRLFKYYSNLGFEALSEERAGGIDFEGIPRQILLKFAMKNRENTHGAAASGTSAAAASGTSAAAASGTSAAAASTRRNRKTRKHRFRKTKQSRRQN